MTRALILGPAELARLSELRAKAEANPISLAQLQRILSGSSPAPGDTSLFAGTAIPMGFWVVYTLERQPAGWARHISVSIDSKRGRVPHYLAVYELARHLGFTEPEKAAAVYIEQGPPRAVNLVELITDSELLARLEA